MEPSCKTLVKQHYEEVVEDVIKNSQEHFMEEGVDDDVIQELKRTWESKIVASKAISPDQPQTHKEGSEKVPVQIVLPAQPQSDAKQKALIVYVPAFALQNNQLYNVLSGPLISATMSLPEPLAASVLQQHMDTAFMSLQQAIVGNSMVAQANTDFGVNCCKDKMENKLMEIQPNPSTSGLNQQTSHENQWNERNNSEKRKIASDDDINLDKKKKMEIIPKKQ